jgi:hypothetical protein
MVPPSANQMFPVGSVLIPVVWGALICEINPPVLLYL